MTDRLVRVVRLKETTRTSAAPRRLSAVGHRMRVHPTIAARNAQLITNGNFGAVIIRRAFIAFGFYRYARLERKNEPRRSFAPGAACGARALLGAAFRVAI